MLLLVQATDTRARTPYRRAAASPPHPSGCQGLPTAHAGAGDAHTVNVERDLHPAVPHVDLVRALKLAAIPTIPSDQADRIVLERKARIDHMV